MRAPLALACLPVLAAVLLARGAAAAPSVWAIDDGEKIRRDATSTPFERGEDNPVWRPGQPVRLFAMRNETVALQVVIESDESPLEGVTVALPELDGPEDAKLVDGAPGPRRKGKRPDVGAPIALFVEHFTPVSRASGGPRRGASVGWEPGAAPEAETWVGPVPDALIPVDLAPAWDPYPMRIEPRSNGIVWIDLEVPRDQRPGTYRGTIDVRGAGGALGSLPVELEVVDAVLPDRTVGTMLGYDHDALVKRVGNYAERQMFQLLHAHRIAPMHDATSDSDVHRQAGALDGSLYTRSMGYTGPAPATGDGVLAVGGFGAFGEPDERTLVRIQQIADAAADLKLFGGTDVFLFAADEQCSSSWGGGWRKMLRASDDASVRRLRVAWTCAMDPTAQPVDVPIVRAAYDAAQVREARAQGKEPWVDDGVQPRTGTFLLDADAVSPRVNGWLSAMFGVPRWAVRESTRWYAAHGDVPVDPFVDAEWLLPDDAGWAEGEGVLLYPGTQLDAFTEHSLGFDGVLPSFRLKNWRRGIEDAGYLQMARARDPAKADAIARWLVPAAFDEARTGEPPSWSARGKPFFDARRALLALALGRTPVALGDTPATQAPPGGPRSGAGCTAGASDSGVAMGLLMCVGAIGLSRARRRRRSAA